MLDATRVMAMTGLKPRVSTRYLPEKSGSRLRVSVSPGRLQALADQGASEPIQLEIEWVVSPQTLRDVSRHRAGSSLSPRSGVEPFELGARGAKEVLGEGRALVEHLGQEKDIERTDDPLRQMKLCGAE